MTSRLGGHERIYRGLLRSYPAEYRRSFGDQMVQLFADQVRDEGATRAWMRVLRDLPSTAASEHLRKERSVAQSMAVAPTPTSRLLGLLGVLGGGVLIAAFVVPLQGEAMSVRLLLFTLGALAVIWSVHWRQAQHGRQLSWFGAVPAMVATAVYLAYVAFPLVGLGGPVANPGGIVDLLAAAMWLSDAWFALIALRIGIVTRVGSLALLVGSLLALAGPARFGLVDIPIVMLLVQIGIVVHGVGWILLGLDVALRRKSLTPARES